jgi:nucleoid-associated protein YgaU
VRGKTYTVQSGDTLTSIASRVLGSGARWRELQKANDSLLHGGDRLTVGMELEIPEGVAAR